MKQWRYFTAFVIASVIFFIIVFAEGGYYQTVTKVKPFGQTNVFQEHTTVTDSEAVEILTESGEFLRLYPESEVDFSGENRKVINGDVFLSSMLLDSLMIEKLRRENDQTKIAQIEMPAGFKSDFSIRIDYAGAAVFISRDVGDKKTIIYAYGHAIEIFLPGSDRPFILPSGNKITVVENKIGDKTGQVSYSKLVKKSELDMQSFRLTPVLEPDSAKHTDRISYSVHQQTALFRDMMDYAVTVPESWIRWRKKTILGKMVRWFQSLSIGYQQKAKQEKVFQNFVEPLVEAHLSFKKNEMVKGQEFLEVFKKQMQDSRWTNLINNTPNLREKWNNFYLSQQALLQSYTGNNSLEKNYIAFWESMSSPNRSQQIREVIFSLEYALTFRNFEKAGILLTELDKTFSSGSFPQEESQEITNFRRILHQILKEESLLRKKEYFDIYANMIKIEKDIQLNSEMTNVILEENAQNLIYFLNELLEEKPDAGTGKVLYSIYLDLGISSLEDKLGKAIFTEEERKIISFMNTLDAAQITKESLERWSQDRSVIDDIITDSESYDDNDAEDTVIKDPNFIESENKLKEFFDEYEIDATFMKADIERNDEGEKQKIVFNNAKFADEDVEGVFNITLQMFDTFAVNGIQEKRIKRGQFGNHLRSIERELADRKDEETEDNQFLRIPQNTIKARLMRQTVQKMFEKQGLTLSMENVVVLDKEMENFAVSEAFLDKKYEISFELNYDTKTIVQVSIKRGRMDQDFPKEEFSYDNFADELRERLD